MSSVVKRPGRSTILRMDTFQESINQVQKNFIYFYFNNWRHTIATNNVHYLHHNYLTYTKI